MHDRIYSVQHHDLAGGKEGIAGESPKKQVIRSLQEEMEDTVD